MALQRESFRKAVASTLSRVGASRIGLVLGTSTSGIRSTEIAYAHRKHYGEWPSEYSYRQSHSIDALCRFVAEILNVQGPMAGVVTACSSSAKAFLIAQKWIQAGLIDAAIVGGVDSLCLSTLHGFNSLQLLSEQACCPFDVARKGISIGEAAGFVLLENLQSELQFIGGGESSDAWHMSRPHPQGAGAQQAIRAALAAAQLMPSDIGYTNAHGTATQANDYIEALALQAIFGKHGVPVSSTKGVTGHTLGAAGIVDAIIAITALERQILPPSTNLLTPDPRIDLDLVTEPVSADLRYVISNNFGFSGSNCSLIFGRCS